MSEAHDIELLYDVWEQNIETLRALHRSTNERPGIVPTMVSHLRACAIDLVKRASNGSSAHPAAKGNGGARHKIDKSVLTISEPKRIRCKEHLRFVASQPCLICGRVPSHAHHVRYAQSRGLSLKVSDEFTVPLCAIHHHHIHNGKGTGVVAGAEHRPAQNCRCPLAKKSAAAVRAPEGRYRDTQRFKHIRGSRGTASAASFDRVVDAG